jgi:hypothetical protein
MKAMDKINASLGSGTLKVARLATSATAARGGWMSRKDNRSPHYTTRWDECLTVRC